MSATGTDAIILLADLTRLKAAAGSVRPCQVIGVSSISTAGRSIAIQLTYPSLSCQLLPPQIGAAKESSPLHHDGLTGWY